MDKSIMLRTDVARMRKVDQLSASFAQKATVAQKRSCALATALASCADEPCGKLSLNELAMVFLHRATDVDAIATVDQHSLFALFIAVDNELQRRKDADSAEHLVPLLDDVPSRSPYSSAVGVDDADHLEMEAFAVRSIHAEVFDSEDYFQ